MRDAFVSCAAGERAVGGGGRNTGPAPATYATYLLDSNPTPDANGATPSGWHVRANNQSGPFGASVNLVAYVICASP